MKKIKALWLKETKEKTCKFNNLEELMKTCFFIGFIPEGVNGKYFIVTTGPVRGLATRPNGTWANIDEQAKEQGVYFTFENEKELLNWMLIDD